MIMIYTAPSCSSCRKAKKWLDDHRIPYTEKDILGIKMTEDDINFMLKNAENGFDDIISNRAKVFKQYKLSLDDMKISELRKFIIKNPSVLKRPIIIDSEKNKMQIGYNDEQIRMFIPKRLRELIVYTRFSEGIFDYKSLLDIYFNELNHVNKPTNF